MMVTMMMPVMTVMMPVMTVKAMTEMMDSITMMSPAVKSQKLRQQLATKVRHEMKM